MENYVKIIQMAAEKFLKDPHNCDITSEEVMQRCSLTQDEVCQFFRINKLGWGSPFHGYSWDKEKKTFTINNGYDILKYDKIQSFEDYIKLNLDKIPVRFGGKSRPSRDATYYRYYDMEELWNSETEEDVTELMTPERDFDENSVFILMPMSDDYELKQVNKNIREVCKEFNLKARRVDDIQDSGNITEEILVNIRKAEFIITDLSKGRPNVYYELGYAHGIGINPYDLILIAKEGSKLHFDIQSLRVIHYKDPDDLKDKLKTRFKSLFDSQ